MRAFSLAALFILAGCQTLDSALPVVGETALTAACQRYHQTASFLDGRLDDLTTEELLDFARLDRMANSRCVEEQIDAAGAARTVDAITGEVQAMAEALP